MIYILEKMITEAVADNATFQYNDMLKEALKHKEVFLSFNFKKIVSMYFLVPILGSMLSSKTYVMCAK